MALTVLGYLAVVCVPEKSSAYSWRLGPLSAEFRLEGEVFGSLGALAATIFVLLIYRDTRPAWRGGVFRPNGIKRAADWFLILGLALEIASIFLISPFPAVRRVLSFFVVATLLIGRLVLRTWPTAQPPTVFRAAILGTIALGLAYYGLDLREACVQKRAA